MDKIVIEVSLEQRDHLVRLIEAAERKGAKSQWWFALTRPLGGLARAMRSATTVQP